MLLISKTGFAKICLFIEKYIYKFTSKCARKYKMN